MGKNEPQSTGFAITDEKEDNKNVTSQPETNVVGYKTFDDVPADARPAIKAAMKKRGIDGNMVLSADKDGNLNLTEDLLRVIVMCYRAGLYR